MGRDETLAALHNYLRPKKPRAQGRKNKSPEFDLVVKPCYDWLVAEGFSVHVVESKAVYSARAGRYLRGMTTTGMSDLVAASPKGQAVFIEAKAPGKRSSLRPAQRDFLLGKIECHAFAVCVDSLEQLQKAWAHWGVLGDTEAAVFLRAHLPSERRRRVKSALRL